MNQKGKIILLLLLCIVIPSFTYANVGWPALLAEMKISSIPIILLSLIVEFFFFKWLFQISKTQALYYTLAANTASSIFGVFLRPLVGIPFLSLMIIGDIGWIIMWIFIPIVGGAISAILELIAIEFIWNHKINKRNFYLTWLVNFITMAIATVWQVTSVV